ncbi:MAG: hypothetical protein WKF94_06470, partial [Solirubrobacteraceae bacterium]
PSGLWTTSAAVRRRRRRSLDQLGVQAAGIGATFVFMFVISYVTFGLPEQFIASQDVESELGGLLREP